MLEIIGWIGGICFAVCAVPQALLAWRQGHAHGVSLTFLGLWLVGEVCCIAYVWPMPGTGPLLTNYIASTACVLVIIRYRVRPRRAAGPSGRPRARPPGPVEHGPRPNRPASFGRRSAGPGSSEAA